MKTENEIREMLDKLKKENDYIMWWDDSKNTVCTLIDALLWVLGDDSGRSIDPKDWEDEEQI